MSKNTGHQRIYSKDSLVQDLQQLGVEPRMRLMVHASFKAIGHVVGGPAAVVLALEEAVTPAGTLVMPTFTEHLCDPKEGENWYPEHQREFVRQHLPLYDPDLTPGDKANGVLPEVLRRQQGVIRSSHPHLSFAAWGKHAHEIIDQHSLHYALGDQSPLGRLYALQGHILLLGAPQDSNTSIHLAEYRQPPAVMRPKRWDALMLVDGERTWTHYDDIENTNRDFPAILQAFRQTEGLCHAGDIGEAESWLLSQVQLVDFAVNWMKIHRHGIPCDAGM